MNPDTGDKLKEYPEASDAELDAAIGRPRRPVECSLLPVAERAAEDQARRRAPLSSAARRLPNRGKEMGKPMEQALGEVDFCGDIYGYYAERAEDFLKDEPIELLAGEGTAVIRRAAMGPLFGIMPWNFPYYQVARFAGPT